MSSDVKVENHQLFANWLLPNYCKKVGLAVVVITLLFCLINKLSGWQSQADIKATIKSFALGLLLVGSLLIIFSREKIEEASTAKRRKLAFIMALVIAPLAGLQNLVWDSEITQGNELFWLVVRSTILWYLLSFYLFNNSENPYMKKQFQRFIRK